MYFSMFVDVRYGIKIAFLWLEGIKVHCWDFIVLIQLWASDKYNSFTEKSPSFLTVINISAQSFWALKAFIEIFDLLWTIHCLLIKILMFML